MSDENKSPDPPLNHGYWPFGETIWLPAAFLPTVIAAIVVILISDGEVALRERNVWLWFILSTVYLYGASFIYGRKKKRVLALANYPLLMTFCLLIANVIVCNILFFVGCVCAASEISRINH